jgi:hypothetical protein
VKYSVASLIRTPLIWMLHNPEDISVEQTIWKSIKCDSFIRTLVFLEDFAGIQSDWINEAPLYIHLIQVKLEYHYISISVLYPTNKYWRPSYNWKVVEYSGKNGKQWHSMLFSYIVIPWPPLMWNLVCECACVWCFLFLVCLFHCHIISHVEQVCRTRKSFSYLMNSTFCNTTGGEEDLV